MSSEDVAHPAAAKAGGMRVKAPHHTRNGSSPPRGVLASAVEMGPDLIDIDDKSAAQALDQAKQIKQTPVRPDHHVCTPTRELPHTGTHNVGIMQPRK